MLFGKYSMVNMCKEFNENKPLIESYFKNRSIEGYDDEDTKIMGLGIFAFIVLLLVGLAIWIWALMSLMKYWQVLPDWAKVLGLLSLIGGAPFITLIVVYIAKNSNSVPRVDLGLNNLMFEIK
jgi:hypothetical protein